MNLFGIANSTISIAGDAVGCRHCGCAAQVGNRLCLKCLLEVALEGDGSDGRALAVLLGEIGSPSSELRLGNYQILEEIGRGGMGVIYRARQRHSRRIVALKRVLSYHADSRETIARFRREAEAAASLDHPNILPIYEVSETEDRLPFFTMKMAVGGTLLQLKTTLRNNWPAIVHLMAKITRAVDYAHSRGILHRDLKPANILLDGRGEPLVSDFGLAKWLDASTDLTRTLTIFGTPGYIAPEQANGLAAHLNATADIYSLGAILFDLLAGRPPFLGEHALAVIKQAEESSAPKLRTLVSNADRDLETICAKCLERDSRARYPSARELAVDLELWLENRPIFARPVSAPIRSWRWAKRNPKLAGSICICLAISAAALAWQTENRHLTTSLRDQTSQFHSIAVLPVLNLDTLRLDPQMAKVIAMSLEKTLSKHGPVRVITAPDVLAKGVGNDAVRDIGSRSNTRTLLTGTRRSVDGKLRLSLRLLDSATGDQLLVRTGIFESSSEVESGMSELGTAEIYSTLHASDWANSVFSARDVGLRNPYVKELIVAGRDLTFHTTLADVERAIACLQKATELEPNSPLAHAYLSSAAGVRSHYVPDKHLLELAETEARAALRLEPNSSDAHRALSGVLYEKGRFAESIEEQLKTAELAGPEEKIARFIGNTLSLLGHPDRALDWYGIAREQEVHPGENDALIGDAWTKLCDDDRAEAAYRRAGQLGPELDLSWLGFCHLRLVEGRFDAAREICAKNQGNDKNFLYGQQIAAQVEFFSRRWPEAEKIYRDLLKKNPGGGGTFFGALDYESALGRLRLETGDKKTARAILEETLKRESAGFEAAPNHPEILYRIAAINACLGRTTVALDRLDAALSAGWIDYRSLSLDPRFDSIRSEKRFQQILDSIVANVAELRRQRLAVERANN
jgi:serine/threonine protein kinase/tetratricopeptide (TPR) repeat protein